MMASLLRGLGRAIRGNPGLLWCQQGLRTVSEMVLATVSLLVSEWFPKTTLKSVEKPLLRPMVKGH